MKLNLTILNLLLFISPIPLFFDLDSFTFVINYYDILRYTTLPGFRVKIPIPLAVLPCIAIYFLGFYYYFSSKEKISFFNSKHILLVILYLYFLILFSIELGLDPIHILQIILFVTRLSFLPKIEDEKLYFNYTNSYLYGVLFWLSLHILSIYITNSFSLIDVDRNTNFTTLFGFEIYQAQVSYAALFSLFTIFALYATYEEGINSYIAIVIFILSILLGFISETRLFFIDFLIIFLGLFLIIYFRNMKTDALFTFFEPLILIIFPTIGFLFYFKRFFEMGTDDRFRLIYDGISTIVDKEFYTQNNIPSMSYLHTASHNFFIDFTIKYGIFNFIFFIGFTIFLFFSVYKKLQPNKLLKIIVLLLIAVTFTNSFFNSAISQPLFLSHLFLISILALSSKKNINSPRTFFKP